MVLLGGRAAEELIFGKDKISTGAGRGFKPDNRNSNGYDIRIRYGKNLGTIKAL